MTSKLHKELILLIKDLDSWLGSIYQHLNRQQFALDKLILKLPNAALAPLSKMNVDLISTLREQGESLRTLSMTPPGVGAAIIDFMYDLVTSPPGIRSSSQKEQYLKNLEKIKAKLPSYRKQQQLDSPLYTMIRNLPERATLSQQEQSIFDDRHFVLGSEMLFQWNTDPLAFKEAVAIAKQSLSKSSWTKFKQAIYNIILDQIKNSFNKNERQEQKQHLDSVFSKIASTQAEQQANLIDILKSYEELISSIVDKVAPTKDSYLHRVQIIIDKSVDQLSQQELDLVTKYKNYFEGLFSLLHPESFASKLQSILDYLHTTIDPLIESYEKQIEDKPSEQSRDQSSPPPYVAATKIYKFTK